LNRLDSPPKITDTLTGESGDTGALPMFVAGIGASAGGLESLEKLFQNLPIDTGMAFVVIQHLSPDFKSMMYELLARDTKMQIHRVEDGMTIHANHVYLLPPKKELVVIGGQLHLIDKDPNKGLTLPIDRFFESLAREYGKNAIAIVLSGSGSDGSRGIRDIAQMGGLVICETQDTAKFDGMPLSAQATGMVDMVIAPEEIGQALVKHAANPLDAKVNGEQAYQTAQGKLALRGIDAIYELFRHEYDLDFSVYKDATVMRRINRRVELLALDSIDDYALKLAQDKTELNNLYQDLLIGVTQFFRDDEPFEYLRTTVIPGLLKKRAAERTIRVWVSGCATGEEAYSIAILLHEAFEKAGRPTNFKLFATDVHQKSLIQAGRGIFREESLKFVSDERRKRYFTRHDQVYQIANEVRERIVFAPHNLLRDAPFTDLDLVSCRNLLIYFQPAAQTKAISMFHFGLNTDGILFLGSSESPGELSAEFETIHERCKVYRKWRQVRLPAELRLPLARSTGVNLPVAAIRGFTVQPRHPDPVLLGAYDHLLAKYMPPSLLINDRRELVDSFGGAEKLLRIPARRPSLDILDLLDPAIRTTLMGAIQRATKSAEVVRFTGIRVLDSTGQQTYNLTVEPLTHATTHVTQYLLTFEPVGVLTPTVDVKFEKMPDQTEVSSAHLLQVEEELRYTKENLQATIEELETSNEELQATNEELVASNEELQSTNEELHSVNEELYTVNAEHQRKIGELAEVNQDMHHLLENTDVATVFLDSELKIRKFTSRVRKIFDFLDQDVGRSLFSFAHRIRLDDFLERLQQVRETGKLFESEVYTVEGACYLLRILPYRAGSRIEGIVIVMVDLSPIEDLRGRLRWMSSIVESTNDAIIGEDLNGFITSWNLGAENLYGYNSDEAIGKHVSILVPKSQIEEVHEYLSKVKQGLTVRALQTIRLHQDGHEMHVSLTVSAVRDSMDNIIGLSKIAHDVTERVEIEHTLRNQAKQRDLFLAMLSHELRNPLSAVLSASNLLTDQRSASASRTRAVTTIQRQASMIASLLDDLLDVSRISLGKIELSLRLFNLKDLIESIQETTLPEIARHQSILHFEMDDGELFVYADRARLIQAHVNLIHNAAKYSPPGSPIHVSMKAEGSNAVIIVRDVGTGIPADFLPQIFEPFVQSDETLDRSEGGLGVGLTLVKSLIEMHGGTIEAFSDGRDRGSQFVIKLPLTNLEPISDRDSISPTFEKSVENQSKNKTFSSKKIVLIEDIEDNREMLKEILQLDGHQVISAMDGMSGFDAILENKPDVALIDIGLPIIDGYEVARRVRRDPSSRHLRMIALTGYGQQEDIAKALDAGFDAHLVKPINPERLARAIEGVKLP
jgi:two-component system, chemotaxis family, CheB/CheR fusion protein